MKAEIVGNNLVLTLPLSDSPAVSSTGKSLIVAGSGGTVKTGLIHLGKGVSVTCSAFIPNK